MEENMWKTCIIRHCHHGRWRWRWRWRGQRRRFMAVYDMLTAVVVKLVVVVVMAMFIVDVVVIPSSLCNAATNNSSRHVNNIIDNEEEEKEKDATTTTILSSTVIQKMEADAIEFAGEIEILYSQRCDLDKLMTCINANYDDCSSKLPAPTCPDVVNGTNIWHVPECGNTCSGSIDFTVSNIMIPEEQAMGVNNNPTDPVAVETVCYTRYLDEYLINKRMKDERFWEQYGIEPPMKYFGSHKSGVVRQFPARHSRRCGSYDARIRPWYVAASSGPKNVIMILDTSGSMRGPRMDLMKEAAKRVVNTLTDSDRIAIVHFGDDVSIISNDGFVYMATNDNKNTLLTEIDNMQAYGSSNNATAAFDAAFDVLDDSMTNSTHVDCNAAILFLTDGDDDDDNVDKGEKENDDDVLDLIIRRLNYTETTGDRPVYLFTYSISEGDGVDSFPARLACATERGVWSKMSHDEDIIDSLSGYYSLFSLGLARGSNENFAAWVEPYEDFHTKELMTTVSVPVYDRSKSNHHVFLGVVGMDMAVSVFGTYENFQNIIHSSSAMCPELVLSTCEMESYRRSGVAGDDALCARSNCTGTDYVQIEEQPCSGVHPTDLWINTNASDIPFAEKACCVVVDDDTITTMCPVEGLSGGTSDQSADQFPTNTPNSPSSLGLSGGTSDQSEGQFPTNTPNPPTSVGLSGGTSDPSAGQFPTNTPNPPTSEGLSGGTSYQSAGQFPTNTPNLPPPLPSSQTDSRTEMIAFALAGVGAGVVLGLVVMTYLRCSKKRRRNNDDNNNNNNNDDNYASNPRQHDDDEQPHTKIDTITTTTTAADNNNNNEDNNNNNNNRIDQHTKIGGTSTTTITTTAVDDNIEYNNNNNNEHNNNNEYNNEDKIDQQHDDDAIRNGGRKQQQVGTNFNATKAATAAKAAAPAAVAAKAAAPAAAAKDDEESITVEDCRGLMAELVNRFKNNNEVHVVDYHYHYNYDDDDDDELV